MSVNECPKIIQALDSMLNCLQCEICKKVTNSPLPGLCSNHMFCKACAGKTTQCPTCKTPFKLENLNTTLQLAFEVLPLLNSIKKCMQSTNIGKPSSEVTDKPSEKNKSINKQKIEKESSKVISPAQPTTSKTSVGRRSSVGSSFEVNKRNKKGETLLHVACIKGNLEEVKRLLAAGARCATKDNAGWTPLHEVALHRRLDIAQLLLENGAKVNAPGFNLNSPLHEAVSVEAEDMVQLLMKYGAFPDQINQAGETPRDLAKNGCLAELLKNVPSEISVAKSISDDFESLLSPESRHLLIMTAGLDKKQCSNVSSLTKVLSVQQTSTPSQDVRLIVTEAKSSNKCERSVAVLTGLSVGAWIVTPEWLEMSVKSKLLVDPEPYEIYGTVNQTVGDAPKRARLNFKNLMPGLFAGCHMYLSVAAKLDDGLDRNALSQIIRLAGGQILSRSPDPEDIPSKECTVPFHANREGPLAKCSHFIIYQSGQKEPKMKYNMQHIKTLPLSWLLDCIENFSLLDPQ